jgi:hypothetical protein
MNTITDKPIKSINELAIIVKAIYPTHLSIIDGPWITLDVNDTCKYTIWLKKSNLFEVLPQKAIWNRTFEMKAKAQEIASKIKEFVDTGNLDTPSGSEIPSV